MSFDSIETSIEGGQPVEVYEITAGAQSFFYTSDEADQTVGVQIYTAIPGLQRGNQEEGPDKREHDFQIELPTSNALAQLFTGVLPGFRVRLQVRKFHRSDTPTPEVVQIFDGFVQSASFKRKTKKTILSARVSLASIGKQIPRRTFQASCNHVLYDPLTCQVDDTDIAFRASVLSVASQVGNVLTVSSGLSGTYTDGFMNGGFLEIVGGSDFRLILDHVGNVLELLLAFSVAPSVVNVFAGCAHTIAVCKSKFNNVDRYGGFAFVPTKNIFQTGLV